MAEQSSVWDEIARVAGTDGTAEAGVPAGDSSTLVPRPRALRRETLDVPADQDIDLQAALAELARRRAAQRIARLSDADLHDIIAAGSPIGMADNAAVGTTTHWGVSSPRPNEVSPLSSVAAGAPSSGAIAPSTTTEARGGSPSLYASPAMAQMDGTASFDQPSVTQGCSPPMGLPASSSASPASATALPHARGAHQGPPMDSPSGGISPQDLFQVLQKQAQMMETMMQTTMLQTSQAGSVPAVIKIREDEQHKLPQHKNVDEATTVLTVLDDFETYFNARGLTPSVSVFLQAVQKGGNLQKWIDSRKLTGVQRNTSANITHWTWEQLRTEIMQSTLYMPVDLTVSFEGFLDLPCPPSAELEDIRHYVHDFDTALNKARGDGLHPELTSQVVAAALLWKKLPRRFRGLISLNSESKETIRTDYPQLKIDINKVLQCPYAQQTYKPDETTIKANVVSVPPASPAALGPRNTKGGGRIGAPGEYITSAPIKVPGSDERAINQFIANLSAHDSRFQGKLTRKGDKLIITHPTPAALDGLSRNRHFTAVKSLIGDLKKAEKITTSDVRPPPVANPAGVVSADAFKAMQDEINTLKLQQAPPLDRANTNDLTASAAASGTAGTVPLVHHTEHPTMLDDTGVGITSFKMPSAHVSVSKPSFGRGRGGVGQARAAILSLPDHLRDFVVSPSAQEHDDNVAHEYCRQVNPSLWGMCLNEADGHVQHALHTFAQDAGITDIYHAISMSMASPLTTDVCASAGSLIVPRDSAHILEMRILNMAPECIRQATLLQQFFVVYFSQQAWFCSCLFMVSTFQTTGFWYVGPPGYKCLEFLGGADCRGDQLGRVTVTDTYVRNSHVFRRNGRTAVVMCPAPDLLTVTQGPNIANASRQGSLKPPGLKSAPKLLQRRPRSPSLRERYNTAHIRQTGPGFYGSKTQHEAFIGDFDDGPDASGGKPSPVRSRHAHPIRRGASRVLSMTFSFVSATSAIMRPLGPIIFLLACLGLAGANVSPQDAGQDSNANARSQCVDKPQSGVRGCVITLILCLIWGLLMVMTVILVLPSVACQPATPMLSAATAVPASDSSWHFLIPKASAPQQQLMANPASTAPDEHQIKAMQAARVCAALKTANSVPPGYRQAMLDSGTNHIMLKHDDDVRKICQDFDASASASGTSANSSFCTDGTGTVGIGMDFATPEGNNSTYNVTTRATLCSQWNFDLVPPSWFQMMGHDVLFRGRQNQRDMCTGTTEVTLHELTQHGRITLGNLPITVYQGISYFTYFLFSPIANVTSAAANIIAGARGARRMQTVKWHIILGHPSAKRCRACLAPAGIDLGSDLPCQCSICSECASAMPSRRHFERRNAPTASVRGQHFEPTDPVLQNQMKQMIASDQASPADPVIYDTEADECFTDHDFRCQDQTEEWACVNKHLVDTSDHELHRLLTDASFPDLGSTVQRKSTRPGQIWHCDTIPIQTPSWDRVTQALVMVDDYSRKVYVYGMKGKNGATVAQHLRNHFSSLGLSRPEAINFFTHRMILKSDQGTEFINHDVKSLCVELGCAQEFSCPGDSGKWQNGIVERRIKELGTIGRKLMHTSQMLPEARMHALYHAADILNALPTTANPGGSDSTGLPPQYVFDGATMEVGTWYAFGSQCYVHLDRDHSSQDKNIQAASCVYLCRAHHAHSSGHILWDYKARRRLTVPIITSSQWNYFPLRPHGQQHLSMFLTWVAPPVDQPTPVEAADGDLCVPASGATPLPAPVPDHAGTDSATKPAHQRMLESNIGRSVRKVFFVNGVDGICDYYEGVVDHVTPDGMYYVVYTDGDSEHLTHRQFLRYHRHVSKHQDIAAQVATLREEAARGPVIPPTCKCANLDTCSHPWGAKAPAALHRCTAAPIRKPDKNSYTPRNYVHPDQPLDYYATAAFGHHYTKINANDILQSSCVFKFEPTNPLAAFQAKLSAYPPDPTSIRKCRESEDWDSAEQGNSWKESILGEWGNFVRYGVVEPVPRDSVEGTIFSTVINFLTKRTKDSTPDAPLVDKRKTRICFGGHRCVPGVHFNKQEAYAPVPTWGVVKIQLALTALHGLKLKAFDCTAAYLQTPMEKEVYATPPPGLIRLLNEQGDNLPDDTVWRLKKCLYGHPLGAALWYRKITTYLKAYGFKQLGNAAPFMILRRKTGKNRGVILLNLYSDDGLASINNEKLWREFMDDFMSKFDVIEKDPDYFLGSGIIQNNDGSIELDPSKYMRESVAKFDMDEAVTSPLPMPAGTKMYMDQGDPLNDEGINLYQQMTGTVMYASLIRSELCYYASQLGKVMSAPTAPHMMLARKVFQYIAGTVDEKITFHPVGHAGFSDEDLALMAFTDSDWACSVDTRRSHGCHVVMLAGAAISCRSRSHKSVMLSTAAAEYYEASESCREVAYIRGILEDFYEVEKLEPTPLYIDNEACIAMGKMPQFSEKQKHIPIRICHLKECCDDGMVEPRNVDTSNEIADIGTKALGLPAFTRLRKVMNGQIPFSSLLQNPMM